MGRTVVPCEEMGRGEEDGQSSHSDAHSPSSLIRCCLLRRASMSKLKSFHSSRGGKEMVWRRVKRTASITRSPRVSLEPTLTVEVPLGVRRRWGGEEKSWSCLWSRRPFQMTCRNCSGIFRLAKSCAMRKGVRIRAKRQWPCSLHDFVIPQ